MTLAGRFFLFFLLFLGFTALGQNASKLSGTVTNAVNKAPVEYATVSLLDPGGKTVSEIITDAKGNFTFKNLSPGVYLLKAGSVGFTPAARSFSVPAKSAYDQYPPHAHIGQPCKRHCHRQQTAGGKPS